MLDRAALRELGAEPREVAGNEPLVLDGGPVAHYVESGSFALFCAEVENGVPVGPRRFLARLGSGQVIFSLPLDGKRGLRLLVVPVEESRLRDLPLERVWSAARSNGVAFAPLVEDWVHQLAEFLTGYPEPRLSEKVTGPGEVKLGEEQTLEPGGDAVAWVEVADGRASCMGERRLTGLMPLGRGMWIRADEPATVRTLDTARLPDTAALEESLTRLHETVLDHLRAVVADEGEEERARLKERARRHADLTAAALGELASVMEPRTEPLTRETHLLTAASAVGEAMGIRIEPPAPSEQLKRVADPLDAIARASRIRVRRVLLAGDWWKRDCGPLVAYSADEERRPLALLTGRGQRYEIYDPAAHTRTPVNAKTARDLHPEAVTLYRPLPPGELGLGDLLRFSLAGRARDIVALLLTALGATLLGMLIAPATGVMMDHAIPDANRRLVLELGLALVAAAIGQTIFSLAQGIVGLRIGVGNEAKVQAALWDRLLALRPAFFRRYSTGDLQDRAMAVSEVSRALDAVTLRAVFSSLMALLNLGLLLYYNARLAMIAVVVALVAFTFTTISARFIRTRMRRLQELNGRFFGLVVQLIGGVAKLRVAGAEQRAYTHWIKQYVEQLRLILAAQRIEDGVSVFNLVLPTVGLASLLWFGYGQLQGGMSLGTFLAFNAAFGTFLGGAAELSNTVIGLMDTVVAGKRIEPILTEEPEADVTKTDPGHLHGRVAMEHVTFRYREDGPLILDDVSFRAEPGEMVAFVGPSGSGKSTVFRLLLGFESPEAGAVLYDGQDLSGLDVVAVRRQLGVVLQSGRLNTGSIFDNIGAGTLITLDEAWAAARDAGIAEDIERMPMGMHTVVSEGGGNLSGGQRQRLLIARALVQHPSVLLFDEATSALDNRTQDVVSTSLGKRRVTRLVIAHRLSTIRDANRIYVIDAGKVVEHGSYEELAAQEGLFARMMRRQQV